MAGEEEEERAPGRASEARGGSFGRIGVSFLLLVCAVGMLASFAAPSSVRTMSETRRVSAGFSSGWAVRLMMLCARDDVAAMQERKEGRQHGAGQAVKAAVKLRCW